MTTTRRCVAGALFTVFALVLTAPMSVADPLEGHYVETETYPDGHEIQDDWFITPCGDGCVHIKELGDAHLVEGQWTLDGRGGVSCEQGGDVRDAIAFHYTWDPDSLEGKVQITNNVAACGNPQGYREVNKLHLTTAN